MSTDFLVTRLFGCGLGRVESTITTMIIEIVRANEHHITELGNLWMEFMRYSHEIDPVFTPHDGTIPIFIKEYLHPAMEAENSLVLVALDEGNVVGYSYSLIIETSNLEDRVKYGCIHDLFITVAHRRKGIGEKMLGEIMKWFYSNDIHRIELDVIAQNQVASSFWKKHGFRDFKRTLYRHL